MELDISPQGNVDAVRVLRGVPLLDQAAVDAVSQWVFEPTRVKGVSVHVLLTTA